MGTFKANTGLPPAFNENGGTQRPGGLWRPWAGKDPSPSVDSVSLGNISTLMSAFGLQQSNKVFLPFNSQALSFHGDQSLTKHPKIPRFVHPVR